MNYQTACDFLIEQGKATEAQTDALLPRLKQGTPPVPGQVTSILLALKVIFDSLKERAEIERPLAFALHSLAFESRRYFEAGMRAGTLWPPLLDEDLDRIAAAVNSIFADDWQG